MVCAANAWVSGGGEGEEGEGGLCDWWTVQCQCAHDVWDAYMVMDQQDMYIWFQFSFKSISLTL